MGIFGTFIAWWSITVRRRLFWNPKSVRRVEALNWIYKIWNISTGQPSYPPLYFAKGTFRKDLLQTRGRPLVISTKLLITDLSNPLITSASPSDYASIILFPMEVKTTGGLFRGADWFRLCDDLKATAESFHHEAIDHLTRVVIRQQTEEDKR